MNKFNLMGLTTLGVSAVLWIAPVFNNFELFPETRICFRPKQILNEENKKLLNCDSNERTGVILTSIFKDLDKRDIEFSAKVASDASTKSFDSNLLQTKNFQLFSILSAGFSVACFGKSEQDRKNKRNLVYHSRRKEFNTNEMLVDSYLNPTSPQGLAVSKLVTNKDLEIKLSNADKLISENSLEIAKNIKEVKKISGEKGDLQTKQIGDGNQLLEERKDSLIEALKSHENGWVWDFVSGQSPLWLSGRMGSGKSWTLCSIGLIRKYCLGIEVGYVIDAHGLGINLELWNLLSPKKIVAIDADSEDESVEIKSKMEMSNAFKDIRNSYLERIKNLNSKSESIQDIIDEFTNYKEDEIIGENACKWYKSHLSDSRKAYRYTTAVTHNDTNASYPDKTFTQRQSQTVLIEKKSKNSVTPLKACTLIRGMYDDEGNHQENLNVTFPDWFLPKMLHSHLTGGEEIEF